MYSADVLENTPRAPVEDTPVLKHKDKVSIQKLSFTLVLLLCVTYSETAGDKNIDWLPAGQDESNTNPDTDTE
jgi:hypothetical protein